MAWKFTTWTFKVFKGLTATILSFYVFSLPLKCYYLGVGGRTQSSNFYNSKTSNTEDPLTWSWVGAWIWRALMQKRSPPKRPQSAVHVRVCGFGGGRTAAKRFNIYMQNKRVTQCVWWGEEGTEFTFPIPHHSPCGRRNLIPFFKGSFSPATSSQTLAPNWVHARVVARPSSAPTPTKHPYQNAPGSTAKEALTPFRPTTSGPTTDTA